MANKDLVIGHNVSNNKLYQRFFKLFCSCHPENTQAINQAKANELWVTVKKIML